MLLSCGNWSSTPGSGPSPGPGPLHFESMQCCCLNRREGLVLAFWGVKFPSQAWQDEWRNGLDQSDEWLPVVGSGLVRLFHVYIHRLACICCGRVVCGCAVWWCCVEYRISVQYSLLRLDCVWCGRLHNSAPSIFNVIFLFLSVCTLLECSIETGNYGRPPLSRTNYYYHWLLLKQWFVVLLSVVCFLFVICCVCLAGVFEPSRHFNFTLCHFIAHISRSENKDPFYGAIPLPTYLIVLVTYCFSILFFFLSTFWGVWVFFSFLIYTNSAKSLTTIALSDYNGTFWCMANSLSICIVSFGANVV